ncbi:hypothetical protein [Methanospirillum hungatei]|uniref:hypothetical protein n=1 Tax=Methanospirillum hungatei TaxID=2203 RepID=UPI0026F06E88|nr:hypothetical protein [Methanospirillum hungatei]MCA1915002.1 hypothetical protein [Methanospirillum hungatei]
MYDLPPDRSGIRYLEMMITPIPHPDHAVGWILVQIADITERKVAEIARIKQIRVIDELINQLDKRWIESDKILQYLQKHHHIRFR